MTVGFEGLRNRHHTSPINTNNSNGINKQLDKENGMDSTSITANDISRTSIKGSNMDRNLKIEDEMEMLAGGQEHDDTDLSNSDKDESENASKPLNQAASNPVAGASPQVQTQPPRYSAESGKEILRNPPCTRKPYDADALASEFFKSRLNFIVGSLMLAADIRKPMLSSCQTRSQLPRPFHALLSCANTGRRLDYLEAVQG
jgi:hypothetical protein